MGNELKPLVPPDLEQCQADVPNGYSFLTLGGRPGFVRCKNRPMTIATEVQPGLDGRCGKMSLCPTCWAVFLKQLGSDYATFEPIIPPKTG